MRSKNIIPLILTTALVFTMTACGSDNTVVSSSVKASTSERGLSANEDNSAPPVIYLLHNKLQFSESGAVEVLKNDLIKNGFSSDDGGTSHACTLDGWSDMKIYYDSNSDVIAMSQQDYGMGNTSKHNGVLTLSEKYDGETVMYIASPGSGNYHKYDANLVCTESSNADNVGNGYFWSGHYGSGYPADSAGLYIDTVTGGQELGRYQGVSAADRDDEIKRMTENDLCAMISYLNEYCYRSGNMLNAEDFGYDQDALNAYYDSMPY